MTFVGDDDIFYDDADNFLDCIREELPYRDMAASKNMIALEINGLHVHLTLTPFPADDTVAAVRAILKNSYVRTLQT